MHVSTHSSRFIVSLLVASALFLVLRINCYADSTAQIKPTYLRCEEATNPLGIESQHPRLSWICSPTSTTLRGVHQTAYQIIVLTSPTFSPQSPELQWNTGKVTSANQIAIPYAGTPIKSATRYWWRARVWDDHNVASAWSQSAFWDTGLLARSDWNATWITAPPAITSAGAPCFRKTFPVKGPVRYARAFVCGLGYHSLYLNGNKADDRLLEPAQTDYEKRALYTAYDVTMQLKSGANEIGVVLGKGWYDQNRVWGGMSYGRPLLLVRLDIEYVDGHRQSVVSGADWQVAAGPIVADNIYAGESYDARRELPGWSNAKLDTSEADRWKPALVVTHEPTARLFSTTMPPIHAVSEITPRPPKEVSPGVLVYDLGQNFAGWARIKVAAPAGTKIQMRFAEAINPSTGKIDTASTGGFATGVDQVDTYICRGTDNTKGNGAETWEPQFTYHGFRYVEVTGLPAGSRPLSLTGVVVHTNVEPVGQFECSDAMINRIHRAAVWTLVSNLHGHPTDCPARERCGWLGDAHACADMAACNFDMANFWTKYVGDIETSWVDTLPSAVSPGKRITGHSGNPDWGVAVALLPWYRYLYYGDQIQLAQDYPLMARLVRTLARQLKAGILTEGYGDWCPPGSVTPVVTPVALTSTAWFIRTATVTARAATSLGKQEEAAEFQSLADHSLTAFRAKFYDAPHHSFGSQTGDAMSLGFDLVPSEEAQQVADDLARDVEAHRFHHDTGIFGSRYLFDALASYGHGDAAWKVLHQTDYPSIGYLFSLGATTFWECWGEQELDKKWGARSLNHPMQAAYDAWFYEGLAGISPDSHTGGYKKFWIRPEFIKGLDWVRAYHNSPYGHISVAWRQTDKVKTLDITVPPNTEATLVLPFINILLDAVAPTQEITESGKPLTSSKGVKFLSGKGETGQIILQSGTYHFRQGG